MMFETEIFSVKDINLKIQETRENTIMLRSNWKHQYECITNAYSTSLHWQPLKATPVQEQQAPQYPDSGLQSQSPLEGIRALGKWPTPSLGQRTYKMRLGEHLTVSEIKESKINVSMYKRYTGVSPKNTEWLKSCIYNIRKNNDFSRLKHTEIKSKYRSP